MRTPKAFLVLTCLLSWPVWVVSGVLPRAGAGAYDARWLVAQIGVFGPTIAALIVSGAASRELRRNSLRLLPVVLVPLVVPGMLIAAASPDRVADLPFVPAVATVVVGLLVTFLLSPLNRRFYGLTSGEAQSSPGGLWMLLAATALPALFLLAWLVTGIGGAGSEVAALGGGPARSLWVLVVLLAHNLLLGGALGEEIGWRGYLLPRLMQRMSPAAASVVVGVVWGAWHLPIDVYAGQESIGIPGLWAVLARIVFAIPLSVLFTWFYLHSKGSILVALLLHASIDVMGDLGLSNFNVAMIGFFVIIGACAWALATFSQAFRQNPTAESQRIDNQTK